MARWDIKPEGVKTVVTSTGTKAEAMGTAVQNFGTSMQNAGAACGNSIVSVALKNFADARTPDFTFCANRVKAALQGTVDAVTHYLQGDLDMATNAQSQAAQKTVPTSDYGPH
ncbi:MAG: hypothetical protein JWM76_508 [Pseudonocardiales bacterium]|nr:hypothetical protein [Pseudonocardiales bacterium]